MSAVALNPRSHSSRAARVMIALMLTAWFLWLTSGMLPVTPIEGDEHGVIFGSTAMATGDARYWTLNYLYDIQPGAYQLISRTSRVTGVSVESVFATLSSGGALLFAAAAALLVQRLLGAPWPLVLTGIFLCQEIWAGAYYMNTTAIGGWLALAALLPLVKPVTPARRWLAAGFLALAGWIRIDCLLLSAAVPAFLWRTQPDWKQTVRQTALIAAPAVAFFLVLFLASGADLHLLVDTYQAREGREGWLRSVTMYPLVTSALLAALSLPGCALLFAKEHRGLALICLLGVLPSLTIYGSSLASNKYLYLTTPFLILPALLAVQFIQGRWRQLGTPLRFAAIGLGGLLLSFDTWLGVLTSSDTFRSFQPRPRFATLGGLELGGRRRELTLGAGELLNTTDGYRLRGGTFFGPATWRLDKQDVIDRLESLAVTLRREDASSVYYGDWLSYQMCLRVLLQEGFVFEDRFDAGKSFPYSGSWRRGHQIVHTAFLAYTDSIFHRPGPRPSNATGVHTYFIGSLQHHGPIAELDDSLAWKSTVPGDFGHIRIVQRL